MVVFPRLQEAEGNNRIIQNVITASVKEIIASVKEIIGWEMVLIEASISLKIELEDRERVSQRTSDTRYTLKSVLNSLSLRLKVAGIIEHWTGWQRPGF